MPVCRCYTLCLRNFLRKKAHRLADSRMDDHAPATMPTISGRVNCLSDGTPKMNTMPMVNSVVSVVLMVRPMVCHTLRSATSSKASLRAVRRFSRTRSNTMMDALIE